MKATTFAKRGALVARNYRIPGLMYLLVAFSRQIPAANRSGATSDAVRDHIIHYRAQLGVYLRLNNVAVAGGVWAFGE